MLNVLWPQTLKTTPGGIARLGRVLHWLFVLVAFVFVIGGGANAVTATNTASMASGLAAMGYGGGGFFIFGRAVRYILAGE